MSNRQLAGYAASSVKPYIAFTAAIWAICGVTHVVIPAAFNLIDQIGRDIDAARFGTDDLQ
jgi:hypothetical protein